MLVRPFNKAYMTRYTTVMFGRVYFPSRAWCESIGPDAVGLILRHEQVHLEDARRFPLIFELSYLFVLPSVFTARAFWEWRAYKETLRGHHELQGFVDDATLDSIERAFTGPDYLYMCPFPGFVRRRLEAERRRLVG